MQIETADALIEALGASGLFPPEQLAELVREAGPVRNDLQSLLKHLLATGRLTVYQLRKVLHGKTAELFLGPYLITDKLGEGGMGRVYRAQQVRIGREVALKVVRPALLANPIIRGRYQREVEAASTLRHPNIVGVVDAGEIDGKYYLAMEFVDGIDLSRLSREYRPLEIAEACEYARQAALGLQHAHDSGFVHRDIKPSNIVVAGERHVPQATERAVVKILDMGLVRSVGFDDGGFGGNDLTRDGTVVGTPDYMAPEQAKNSSAVDHRADLYSLGCTLYFLLAGQPPFAMGTPIEKLLKHQLDAPLPLQALRPEISGDVAATVARLMAKKPADRFQTAGEVAEALAPLSVYPPNTPPVPIRARKATHPNAETLPPSGRTTIPPAPRPSSAARTAPPPAEKPASLAQPVAPSDHTPRPGGLPAPLQTAVESASPFSSLTEPPSEPLGAIKPEPQTEPELPAVRRPLWPWVALAVALVAAGIGLFIAFNHSPEKPQSSQCPPPPPPDHPTPPKPPTRPGIVPTVNFTRLNSHLALVPDGSSLVVVAYPAVYLKEKDSPFAKGAGPGKLAQWANKLANDTALPLARADRVVFSVSSISPDRFLLVGEGDFITAKFADTLVPPKFTPLNPGEKLVDRPFRLFSIPRGRLTGLITPPTTPQVYVVASERSMIEKLRPRLMPSKATPPDLDTGMLPALAAATEHPPLFLAVAGASCRLPARPMSLFGHRMPPRYSRALGDYGLELLTLKVRVTERMEIEVTATGADEGKVKEALAEFAAWLRAAYPRYGTPLADVLTRGERTGETIDGKYRLTIKANWNADQWSAFLDNILTP